MVWLCLITVKYYFPTPKISKRVIKDLGRCSMLSLQSLYNISRTTPKTHQPLGEVRDSALSLLPWLSCIGTLLCSLGKARKYSLICTAGYRENLKFLFYPHQDVGVQEALITNEDFNLPPKHQHFFLRVCTEATSGESTSCREKWEGEARLIIYLSSFLEGTAAAINKLHLLYMSI